jgi:hypothetical protein
MKQAQKILLTSLKVAGILLVVVVVSFFALRNTFLQKAIHKIEAKVTVDYGSSLTIGRTSFTGLTGVKLEQVSLVPLQADTILQVENIQASVSFWYALIGDIRLQNLVVQNGFVQFVKNENGRNIDVFIKGKSDSTQLETQTVEEATTEKINYAKLTYRFITKALNLVPTHMSLQNLALKLNDNGNNVTLHLQTLTLADKQLLTTIDVTSDELIQQWKISGTADPRGRTANLEFFNNDTGKILIPYINQRFNMLCGFDSIKLNLASVEMSGDELNIKGYAAIKNFMVNHPKIAKKDVVIDEARFDYAFKAGADFVCLDSTSVVQFNNVKFVPYVGISTATDTIYQMHITIPNMLAQDFIASLPEGLFSHFKGMQTIGTFDYRMDFVYNENKPQALIFESSLKKNALQIVKYGEANLSKLNGDFVYTPVEYGRPQRPILVSLANPNYTLLNQISPYLQKCVLTTEDPSFFYHRGFIDEAFRQSIIKNIRQRKFARGASTISMQLVKNVFLTREKTISRKLEEILLVYILENNRISSKERMLEVYFNIIEWGPNVYGIGEAAQFYFQKRPADLTLNECLFLATIIPRPKGFMWRFGKDGNLKPFADKQFTFLTNLMLRRNVLLPEDTLQRSTPIFISGSAKSFIKITPDSTITDSIIIDENGRVSELIDSE